MFTIYQQRDSTRRIGAESTWLQALPFLKRGFDALSEHARRKITCDHAAKLFQYDLSAN